MTKTYTLAIGADMLLATVPDGSDIEAAVLAECAKSGIADIPSYDTECGVILVDDPVDDAEIVWHSGNSGWLFDSTGETRRFAVRA